MKSFLILFSLLTTLVSAQSDITIPQKLLNDGLIFLKDGGQYFTYPLRMNSCEFLYAGAIAAGTYGLMYNDQTMKDAIGRETIKTLNGDFWDAPTYYGFVQYANIAAFSTYTVGLFSGEDEIRKVGRMLIQSLSYSGITVMFIRTLFGRERPYSGEGPWAFTGLSFDNEIQSFPSGHCTVAFAFSTVLAEYFDTIYSRVFFYGLGSLTAYARILNNQHWFSDILMGSLIGISGGIFVINEENNRESNNKFSISPTFNGVRFTYRF
ncbi:MAG: phosphatase PAP2 family protein [Ignavibacteriales bacterium]|nr:phosphatase PAP2 family protein [Ignavibacteriales bacterium]